MKVNGKDYQIIQLLGKGKGGYSYLVEDDTKQYVLKQIHHEPCAYYTFSNKLESEINDYQRLYEIEIKMPKLIEVDVEKERILKEYIPGNTIYDCVLQNQMKASYYHQIKEISKKLFEHHLNIDYYPTNFVVYHDELYYVDYECNEYMDKWNYENWGSNYWTKSNEFFKTLLGKVVHVIIDRPLGSAHPNYSDMIYPINYGYVEGIVANDQEEQDVYVLGVNQPIEEVDGKIIAIITRKDDNEEKWVVSNQIYSKEEIKAQVYFCEQYFDFDIIM